MIIIAFSSKDSMKNVQISLQVSKLQWLEKALDELLCFPLHLRFLMQVMGMELLDFRKRDSCMDDFWNVSFGSTSGGQNSYQCLLGLGKKVG